MVGSRVKLRPCTVGHEVANANLKKKKKKWEEKKNVFSACRKAAALPFTGEREKGTP